MAEDRKPDAVADDTLVSALAAYTGRRAGLDSIDRASLRRRDESEVQAPRLADDGSTVDPAAGMKAPEPIEAADRGPVAAAEPIALDIAAALADVRGVEGVAIIVAGVPGNARLSAGTDNGDGTWTLSPDQIDSLSLLPAAGARDDVALSVTAVADDLTLARLAVTVEADAAPREPIGASQMIALDVAAALADVRGAEGLAITVAGLPDGARLSAGTDNGDGSWRLAPHQLDGLGLGLPPDAEPKVVLAVVATAGADPARTLARLVITVETLADPVSDVGTRGECG